MAGIQNTDFGFFPRQHGFHHFHADFFQRRTAGNEIIFDHPLNEGFTHQRRQILEAGFFLNTWSNVGGRTWRDTVHHGIWRRGEVFHPVQHRHVAFQCQEGQETVAEAFAVVTQVIAVQQGHRTGFLLDTLAQNAIQRAVNGAGFTQQVGLDIRIFRIQFVFGIQIVTALGHGKADHAGFRRGTLSDQRRQLFIPRQHFLDGRDAFIFPFTGR